MYDINPIAHKFHLSELDRQALKAKRDSENSAPFFSKENPVIGMAVVAVLIVGLVAMPQLL